ncbi:MAG TPA: hypothetical protein VES67_10910 [Vicinamibacterales bacterium]|nr:hypothetical protein [Vicinamibacterales bacterium]
MTQQLIGDRFLADGSGRWIDLATGGAVRVVVRPIDDEWVRIERRLREESRAPRCSWPRLVDFGRVNAREWFEARSNRRNAGSGRTAAACRSGVTQVASVAEVGSGGIRHVRVVTPGVRFAALASAIATVVRPLGFLTLRADARLGRELVDALTHRHLIVLYRSDASRAPVIRWIRHLPATSPRAHLVVELDDEELFWMNVHQFPVAGWHERVATACFEARKLMDTARLEHAEALLAALDAEAAVRRVQSPDVLHMTWVRLRSCQGRVEEAQKRLSALSMNRGSCERDNASASRHSGPAALRARR